MEVVAIPKVQWVCKFIWANENREWTKTTIAIGLEYRQYQNTEQGDEFRSGLKPSTGRSTLREARRLSQAFFAFNAGVHSKLFTQALLKASYDFAPAFLFVQVVKSGVSKHSELVWFLCRQA